jgi:predicted Zn-dependent protease
MKRYAASGLDALKVQMQNPDSKESSSGFEANYELANLELRSGAFDEAKKAFEDLAAQSKQDQQAYLRLKARECDARKLEEDKHYDSAYSVFTEILSSYGPTTAASPELQDLRTHLAFDSTHRGQ